MWGPGPGDGHVALHGDGGHGEDRRNDGHVGHEVGHLAEDHPENPVSGNIIETFQGNDNRRARANYWKMNGV